MPISTAFVDIHIRLTSARVQNNNTNTNTANANTNTKHLQHHHQQHQHHHHHSSALKRCFCCSLCSDTCGWPWLIAKLAASGVPGVAGSDDSAYGPNLSGCRSRWLWQRRTEDCHSRQGGGGGRVVRRGMAPDRSFSGDAAGASAWGGRAARLNRGTALPGRWCADPGRPWQG